ncbi:hypothetical protein niasHS_001495 [Heterodera schachtii]|uniref:Uncharacterized protein n=1 Tax=Heterodera schachtii TaxID=97005 RepID=A0ABD2KEF1_HETSC
MANEKSTILEWGQPTRKKADSSGPVWTHSNGQANAAASGEKRKMAYKASDADTMEEEVKEEMLDGSGQTRAVRKEADMAAFSGANAVSYTVMQKGGAKRNNEERHPLFKRDKLIM